MRTLALLGIALLPFGARAAEPALPYAGAPGALPLEVVLKFLGTRLGANGQFDYRSLIVTQDSLPPSFDKANLTVIREAVNDPVKRGIRLRYTLTREGTVWTIRSEDEDFSCRYRIAWGTRPCPVPVAPPAAQPSANVVQPAR
jgi:hypothetical protein